MDNTNKDKRTCPFCGKEVKDTDQFCEHCDAYLKAKQIISRRKIRREY